MPVHSITVYELNDFAGLISDPLHITETMPDFAIGTSVTLDAGAVTRDVDITDDDTKLQDGYREVTGTEMSELTNDVTVDGVTYPAGSSVEAEYSLITNDVPAITLTIVRIGTGTSNSGENVLVIASEPLTPGSSYSFVGETDGPFMFYSSICFAQGTEIQCVGGGVFVEDLAIGDQVITRAAGPQSIRWIGKRRFSKSDLLLHPDLRPVVVCAGALGENLPTKDLVVSPQHRIFLSDWRAEYLFGAADILVPAKAMINDQTIRRGPVQDIYYYHILLDSHEVVLANGQWAETLLLGPEALAAIEIGERSRNPIPPLLGLPGKSVHTVATTISAFEYRLLEGF